MARRRVLSTSPDVQRIKKIKKSKGEVATRAASDISFSLTQSIQNQPLQEKNYYEFLEHEGYFNSSPKDILGLTEGQVNQLYNEAIQYLALHEVQYAIKGFQFLCSLCPYDADFWMGYAAAMREDGNFLQALSAFLMVETIDPDRFDMYREAIACCLEMKQQREAQELLSRCKKRRKTLISDDELANIPYEIDLLQQEIRKNQL